MDIIDHLGKGKENAIAAAELSFMCGLSKREIRQRVQTARENGLAILSESGISGGYYMPNNRAELEHFINSMSQRGRSAFKAARAARKILKEWPDE